MKGYYSRVSILFVRFPNLNDKKKHFDSSTFFNCNLFTFFARKLRIYAGFGPLVNKVKPESYKY